jgi:hypothetical protein
VIGPSKRLSGKTTRTSLPGRIFSATVRFVTGDAAGTERDVGVGMRACSHVGWAWGAAWLGRSQLKHRSTAESVAELRLALDRSRAIGDPPSALSLCFYGAAVRVWRELRQHVSESELADWIAHARLLGETDTIVLAREVLNRTVAAELPCRT